MVRREDLTMDMRALKETATVKAKLIVKPQLNPTAITAHCSSCLRQIVNAEYGHYEEYKRKKRKYETTIKACPYCGAIFHEPNAKKPIAWTKMRSDYIADCENGRFIVFKWGRAWRWSFRYYNEETPRAENTGVCLAIESAKRVCERHREWK